MIKITDETTVEDALIAYVEYRLPTSQKHKTREIFDRYVDEDRSYIGHALQCSDKAKFSYVQISSMCLDTMILEVIKDL